MTRLQQLLLVLLINLFHFLFYIFKNLVLPELELNNHFIDPSPSAASDGHW